MPYYPINNNPILPANLANQKGVYVIYALNPDESPQPLNRVLKTDKNGVLYIGQTTDQDFKTRLDSFKRVMNPALAANNHSGALNMKEIEHLRERFPITTLFVSIIPSAAPKQEETRMIEAYRQEFGEVPPLNGSK